MTIKKILKNRLIKAAFGLFLVLFGMIPGLIGGFNATPVFAEPVEQEVTEEVVEEDVEPAIQEVTEQRAVVASDNGTSCKDSMGSIGWLVCPVTGTLAKAIDFMYGVIRDILVVNPVEIKDGQPVYEIWKYFRSITNIVFIIFLLVVVYSQITGFGISNYGIKKALPKLIVMAIMVNLSFIVCSLLVDVSNIVGEGLRSVFENVETASLATMNWDRAAMGLKMSDMFEALAGGLVVGGVALAFNPGSIFMLVPVVLGAIVAVASGLITIALRQAVVVLLIVIAPLAMVANVLPNTESLFKKWKNLLTRMLVFYPMFSLLFGASHLAGFAIIASAKDGFGLIIGMAVQIFPLFFCWKLMEMSGTMLGTINSKLRGLASKPISATQGWAESRKRMANAKQMVYGKDPASHLKRYLDNRMALRESTTKNLQTIRQSEASTYVQRKIAAGYRGEEAKSPRGDFRPNMYTRIAKDASMAELKAKRVGMDTKHAISNYGDYYVKKALRDGARYNTDRAGMSEEALRIARANDADYQRNAESANEFLELYRAQMVEENDAEADINFASGVFLRGIPKDRTAEDIEKYKHYMLSATGALGEAYQARVRGKVIARAAGVEAAQRRDIAYVGAKNAVPKDALRVMVVGYHRNSDGYAIGRDNKPIETERAYLLNHDPSKLWWWENVDPELGPYFDWIDEKGNFITRVYKSNTPAMKELLSNFDIQINDPINNLYTILSGIDPDPNSDDVNMRFVGLGKMKTTLSSALGVFKEKNASFGPMVMEMAKKGNIKNSTDLFLAYADSINKTTKPGNYNVQDGDAIKMNERLLDRTKWKDTFRIEELRQNKNIDDQPLYGIEIDASGNIVKDENNEEIHIPIEQATDQQIMNTVEKKFIEPAVIKIVAMMSRVTPNTLDNQKVSTTAKWAALVKTAEEQWGDVIEKEGYGKELSKAKKRYSDRLSKSDKIRHDAKGEAIIPRGEELKIIEEEEKEPEEQFIKLGKDNILVKLEEMYNSSLDSFSLMQEIDDYLDENGLDRIRDELHDRVDENTMTPEEIYRIAANVFGRHMDD